MFILSYCALSHLGLNILECIEVWYLASQLSFLPRCSVQRAVGHWTLFSFFTSQKHQQEKPQWSCFMKTNRQHNSQQIFSSLALMWRFNSEHKRAWGLNCSLAWTSGVAWKKFDQIKSISRQHLSCQDKMGSLLFLWDSGLISSLCHSNFLSPLANPPGFITDVWSLLEIIVQAKRLVSYQLQALGNTNGKLFTQKVRWGDKWRVRFGPLKMLGAWTKLTH